MAIDGPAGAGKSTIAKALARRLGLEYLDTGAMYRAVTQAALMGGIDPGDTEAVRDLADRCELSVTDGRTLIDGVDVSVAIRGSAVTAAVSMVASNSGVREAMRRRQRRWGDDRRGGVIEGRDIGSVVFPDARLKIYLTASARVRAERRVAEVGGDVDEMEALIADRDHKDSTRTDSPLLTVPDAVVVDTGGRSVDAIVEEIARMYEEGR
ncbi:MAG: (d)CMP kinase [Acidimicrobiia bacterium]